MTKHPNLARVEILSFVIRHSDLIASIHTPGVARFCNDYFDQFGQLRLESLPDPDSDNLASGVRKSRDLVQIIVVELFPDGLKERGDLGIIHHPPELRVAFARNHDLDFEAVAVQPPALMRLGQMWQQVRGFKLKGFS